VRRPTDRIVARLCRTNDLVIPPAVPEQDNWVTAPLGNWTQGASEIDSLVIGPISIATPDTRLVSVGVRA